MRIFRRNKPKPSQETPSPDEFRSEIRRLRRHLALRTNIIKVQSDMMSRGCLLVEREKIEAAARSLRGTGAMYYMFYGGFNGKAIQN